MRISFRLPESFPFTPILVAVAATAAIVNVVACSGGEESSDQRIEVPTATNSLEQIRAAGVLRVATRNAPTMFFYDRHDAPAGPEVVLARGFASFLGVRVEFDVHHSVADVLGAVETGEAHLAAAGLNPTITRAGRFLFGPEYQRVKPQVVCRRDGARPASLVELAEEGVSLEVMAGSSYAELLRLRRPGIPRLAWTEVEEVGTEQLLEHVWKGEIDCTVADSNIVAVNRRYHPELVIAFDLDDAEPLVWVLPREAEELRQAIEGWLAEFRASGGLDDWYERFYAPLELFDFVDIRAFHRRLEERYPKYRDWFVESADRHGVPWTVLSAQSYQESHWNPRAKSPTGVRGIMMLTQPTAKSVGVTNRLEPKQNIEGGAKYLAQIESRLDPQIQGLDRLYLALAAYNVGLGHLRDAQTLAQRLDKDPNRWVDLKDVLPLLTQRKYYTTVKYGYARGHEPVRYVEQIRNYADILERELGIRR
jgi:membrane-bound lytic murein transglycosylase F